MKRWIKELLWLTGLISLSIVSVYLMNRGYDESIGTDYMTVSIGIHDTYFVIESHYFAGAVFAILMFVVYLLRTLISRFRNNTLNCLLIIGTILSTLLLTFVIHLNELFSVEGGWTIYPPLSAQPNVVEIEERTFLMDGVYLYIFQVILMILLTYTAYRTAKNSIQKT